MKNSIVFNATLAITAGVAVPVYAACMPAPDCASLGYTAASCPNGGVKCPFDTSKWFCLDKPKVTTSDICKAQGYDGVSCDYSCNSYGYCEIDRIGSIQCARFRFPSYGGIGLRTDENGVISCTLDCKIACSSLPKLPTGEIWSSSCKYDAYTQCGSSSYLAGNCSCVAVECIFPATFNYGTQSCKLPSNYCTGANEYKYYQPGKSCTEIGPNCYRCY